MGQEMVRLRRIETDEQLEPPLVLASEYGAWALEQARLEYGIDLSSESERGLSVGLAGLLTDRGRLYLAERGDEPVGIAGLKPIDARVAEIKRMYVRPSSRGLGVGRMLLHRLLDDARELDYGLVRLESAAFMRSAHALYRSFGFEPTPPYEGREFADIRAVDDISVFMALRLEPTPPPPN
jgi:GNAT superfamily N-acetyltransferase